MGLRHHAARRAGTAAGWSSSSRFSAASRRAIPGSVEAFFSSHPSPQDRIARLQADVAQRPGGTRDSQQFQQIKARLLRMPAPRSMPRRLNTMPNRLAAEQSPYLLQHKDNPVDWYPWGDAAFEKARREDKPIFLSIGYSTCHWCHVMEHESFEDANIADVLNRHYVSIKVDREERPDVDRVYMTFVQVTTGSGGWPMSVWLTPSLRAVLRRHLLSADVAMGQARLRRSARRGRARLAGGAAKVLQSASSIVERLRTLGEPRRATRSSRRPACWTRRCTSSRPRSTARRGGFGDAPKFPRPSELLFLLREHRRDRRRDRARHGARDAPRDGARRHARPHRRRVPSLLGGRRLAGPALRKDAVRPGAAGARLRRGGAADRRSVLRGRRGRHARVRAPRPDASATAGSFRRRMPTASRPSRPAIPRRTRARARSTSGGTRK